MSRLFLHVGHGKTGSSYIQALCAQNVSALACRGIVYPPYGNLESSRIGTATSGNGHFLFNLEKLKTRLGGSPGASVLLSGEHLFVDLLEKGGRDQIRNVMDALDLSSCAILLFIRDPMESVISYYTQLVKGQGRTESIEELLASFNIPDWVLRFIDAFDQLPEIDLTVRNYSRRRHALDQVVADWLGVPEDDLAAPPVSTVNRSLTRSETALLRELNKYLDSSAGPIGKRLVTKAPNVSSDPVTLPVEAQHELMARLRPTIDAVNEKLADPADRYSVEPRPAEAEPEWLTFDPVQVKALAAEFAETIDRERQKALLSAARTVWARAPEAALDLYDQAVQVRPNALDGHEALLDALTRLNRWQDMEDALARAVASVPEPLAYRHRLAKWYLRADRPEAAIEVLRQAVDDGTANAHTFWLLARGYYRLPELEAALAAIDSALDMGVSPHDRGLSDKGRILEARGETDAALRAYQQSLRFNVENQAARTGQSRLRGAGDAVT